MGGLKVIRNDAGTHSYFVKFSTYRTAYTKSLNKVLNDKTEAKEPPNSRLLVPMEIFQWTE